MSRQIAIAIRGFPHEVVLVRTGQISRYDELFKLVTAYDPEMDGQLATMTRTLERTIYYWVHIVEMAARIHVTLDPDYIRRK